MFFHTRVGLRLKLNLIFEKLDFARSNYRILHTSFYRTRNVQ